MAKAFDRVFVFRREPIQHLDGVFRERVVNAPEQIRNRLPRQPEAP